MTAREWMQKNRPDEVDGEYCGGVLCCPGRWGLKGAWCDRCDEANVEYVKEVIRTNILKKPSCESCWDHELTAEEIASAEECLRREKDGE